MVGKVPSPIPRLLMSADSTSVMRTPSGSSAPRVRARYPAVIQPAVPPPTIKTRLIIERHRPSIAAQQTSLRPGFPCPALGSDPDPARVPRGGCAPECDSIASQPSLTLSGASRLLDSFPFKITPSGTQAPLKKWAEDMSENA